MSLDQLCRHIRVRVGLKQGWQDPSLLEKQGEQVFSDIGIKLKRKNGAQNPFYIGYSCLFWEENNEQ